MLNGLRGPTLWLIGVLIFASCTSEAAPTPTTIAV